MDSPLPYRVIEMAARIFAGSSGMSYAEMDQFFSYAKDDSIEKHADLTGSRNRTTYFKACLQAFRASDQRRLLKELCDQDESSFWWGKPSVEELGALLAAVQIGSPSEAVITEVVEKFDSVYVSGVWTKALKRLETDPDGAITSARAFLEAVCKHILDDLSIEYGKNNKLNTLYKKVADSLSLSPEQHQEDIFKHILGGCSTIVGGLAALRNNYGDAHGKGPVHYRAAARHASLAVNLAGTISMFLVETWQMKKSQ